MQDLGFVRGLASGCIFYHPGRDLRVAVYGDDFTIVGSCQEIDWLETSMEERYAITKRGRLGSSPEDCKELTLLNRIVRWVDGVGIEVEADPRQSERLVAQLGLTGAKLVTTPGVKPTVQELEADDIMYDERCKVYQGGSARANYMGLDRPETQYAVKECCRWMSAPTELALKSLKRVGRFVEGQPRLVLKMMSENNEKDNQIDVYVDSDYAGCPRTRKSTSGGCVILGGHLIKYWSSTQNNAISLSSGEAELYAVVKGVGVGMGVRQYMRDLGMDVILCVHTNPSAVKGICNRVGLGTQRHIAVNTLWVQEKLRRRQFELFKVKGEDNPADLLTKHLTRDKTLRCLTFMSCEYREGRAQVAPKRKDDERIVGEDMDWQMADAARQELEDNEAELRLLQEEVECDDAELQIANGQELAE